MNILQAYDSIAMELEEVREIFEGELLSDVPHVADLIEEVSKFRGKMLRPALVLLCGKACGGITPEHHIIGAVMEMIHMASLIHDDVLDGADKRRRGKTINRLHGNAEAVLLGDFFVGHAFHLFSSLGQKDYLRLITATTNTMCEGELMQLHYRNCYELTEEKYLEIIGRKTAGLIGACCYLGARACGVDETTSGRFEDFGVNLGFAFQIMDDVTDMIGDEKRAGKPVASDLFQGKLTLPCIHFLGACRPRQREWLRELVREQRMADYPELVAQLQETDSIDYARRRAGEFIAKAQACLPDDSEVRSHDVLRELALVVID